MNAFCLQFLLMRGMNVRKKLWGAGLAFLIMLAQCLLIFGLGTSPASATTSQCLGVPIPSGDVATAIYTTSACGSSSNNTVALSPIANGIAMCSQAMAVPSGWVVTAISNTGTCGGYTGLGNTYVLETPTAGLGMCSQASRAPSGWVVTSVFNTGTCSTATSNGNTYYLALPSAGLAICDVTGIPTGYHVTSVYNSANCGEAIGGGGGNTDVIEA